MSVLHKFKTVIKSPLRSLRKIIIDNSKYISNDKLYLSLVYFLSHKRRMHWKNPRTFNEKINWLKLWSKDKGFERYVDKYEVRKFVREKIGDEYLIPLLGVWDSFEEIDFASLPKDYVLKTTHDSGGIWIIKDGKCPDGLEAEITKRMKVNFFYKGREHAYKNIVPKIIAEQFMIDESGNDLKDYKFFCFNGESKFLYIASERFKKKGTPPNFDFFDLNLVRLPFNSKRHRHAFKPGEQYPVIPGFNRMIEIANKLSKGFPFVRVDLYNILGKIYFGEMTFYHEDGLDPLDPYEWDKNLGDMIILPKI